MLRRIAQAFLSWNPKVVVDDNVENQVRTATPAVQIRAPKLQSSSSRDRTRVSSTKDPLLEDILESGFADRLVRVRAGQAGVTAKDRVGVFRALVEMTAAQRQALRDRLIFRPPHPNLKQMYRRDRAVWGPPTPLALMRILTGELFGASPQPTDGWRQRIESLPESIYGADAGKRAERKALLLAHTDFAFVAEMHGPGAFEVVERFGVDAIDALVTDTYRANDLFRLGAAHPECIEQARAFFDKVGPEAFDDALDDLYSARYSGGFSLDEFSTRLGFAAAAEVAGIIAANEHGLRAHRALHPQDNLLEMARQGPEELRKALATSGRKVAQFGVRGVPLMNGTTNWPPLSVPATPKIEAAETRLLAALGMEADALEDPSKLPLEELSRLIRAMRKELHAADPEASKTLSRELLGRRFVSRHDYDALYDQGVGNPEHRYSVATFDSWRKAEAFARDRARADRGQPLTRNRVLEVLSGIHRRAGEGIVAVTESHLTARDLGRYRDASDQEDVRLGSRMQTVDAAGSAALAANPYLQKREPFELEGKFLRDVVFAEGSQVPKMMQETADWIVANEKKLSPDKLAAEVHFRLVSIHPFMDGNGRSSKLFADYLLRRAGVEPALWRQRDVLLNQDWPGALREGVAFNLETVQRYYRTMIEEASPA